MPETTVPRSPDGGKLQGGRIMEREREREMTQSLLRPKPRRVLSDTCCFFFLFVYHGPRASKRVSECGDLTGYEFPMDRADVEREEEEGEKEKSSWVAVGAAIIRNGLWLGKKIAIAGAAITSAPVVIPPLLVLSTICLAFSFPFGIYVAGYASANKIMSALLPLPPSAKENDDDEEDEREALYAIQGEKPMDDADQYEEIGEKGEIWDGERVLVVPVEGEIQIELLESGIWGGKEEDMVKAMESWKSLHAIVAEEDQNNGSQQGKNEEEGDPAALESSKSTKSPYTAVVIGTEPNKKKENQPPNLSAEHLSMVELREEGKANEEIQETETIEGIGKNKEEVIEEGKGLRMTNSAAGKNIRASSTKNRQGLAKPGTADVVSTLQSDDDKGIQSEEQLWDQILSMRTIVGYKAVLNSSLVEELRELYLFTGVEPPFSLNKDSADLGEVSNSLQFLKSVVGVK